MSTEHLADAAGAIVRVLRPESVLVAGRAAAPLAAAIERHRIHVRILDPQAAPSRCFDLAVCTGVDGDVPAPHVLSERTARVLLMNPEAGHVASFAQVGLAPDFTFDASSLAPGALLLRKGARGNQVQELTAEVLRLREELRTMREHLAVVSAAVEQGIDRQGVVNERLDAALTQQHKMLDDILRSRIWRTLCAGGARLMHLSETARRITAALDGPLSHVRRDRVRLAIEEPASDTRIGSSLHVRGWAIAKPGIERVEVEVDTQPVREARIGLATPAMVSVLPGYRDAAQCGFALEIKGLPREVQVRRVSVRAVSRGGASRSMVRLLDHRPTEYERWIAEFENDAPLVPLRLRNLRVRPLVSIVMPVYRTAPEYLERAIESVRAQSYAEWELCVADDASQSPEVDVVLERAAASDPRVHVTKLAQRGGISAASNAALAMARGEYVALLDHDDALAPHALLEMVEAIGRAPEAGFFYSDEDKISQGGRRYEPFFKPAWSPDLLLSENYVCHFLVARRELITQAGGFRSEFDGSQDYDLVLRLSELTSSVVHVPKVLYHWRAADGSAAACEDAKPGAEDAARRAIADHLRRTGQDATVSDGLHSGRHRVRYAIPPGSRVTIVIPTAGRMSALEKCLQSLCAPTVYTNFDVLVVDNSHGGKVDRLVRRFAGRGLTIRTLDWRNRAFNYSAMNNAAARETASPFLLFLNDDTEAITPDWIEAMLELGARPGTGVVGARLLFPDGRIQHAGVALGVFDHCGHPFRGLDSRRRHYFDLPDVIRNVSAVTGACMLVRADVFREAGGFDEARFPIAFNDTDLCLRVGRLGYRVVYTPHAALWHYESLTRSRRGMVFDASGSDWMRLLWKDVIAADPFYNTNLTRTAEDYSPRRAAASGV